MREVDAIGSALRSYTPKLIERDDVRRAAVAMVLRGRADRLEVLFIERARHPQDPWSGHMAFPGGRVEPLDATLRAAAERETHEEVGLSLEGARALGRLDDLEGRHAGRPAGLVISAFVYHHAAPGELITNEEVESAHWVPMPEVFSPERRVAFEHPAVPGEIFPGILVGEPDRHVVWGLTYRFLEVFSEAVGRPFPDRWGTHLER
jgi:8-oxo-dGTP pyrophosphatase MutT (NUDIX family)